MKSEAILDQSVPDLCQGIGQLREELAGFRYSLFRLETLQNYSGSSEDEAFAEWRRTGRLPVTAELEQWCVRTRQAVAVGCRVQRVHVVTEPLSDYVRFELASYAPNVQSGEEVRIISVRGGRWPTDVSAGDFWLIDARKLWTMRYAADGAWLGAEPTTDPQRLADACAQRDAALAQSVSWSEYNVR